LGLEGDSAFSAQNAWENFSAISFASSAEGFGYQSDRLRGGVAGKVIHRPAAPNR